MELDSIRKHTLHETSSLGVKIPAHLPPLDGDEPVRDVGEVVDRMMCVHIVCAVDAGLERKKGIDWLVREHLYDHLITDELNYLKKHHLRKNQRDIQVESVFALMWIAGLIDGLDFRRPCPDDLVFMLPNPLAGDSSSDWRRKARLRETEELVLARDLAYCLHWAVVEARFKGRTLRKVDVPGVPERRRALEWMFVKEDWDEVPLDT